MVRLIVDNTIWYRVLRHMLFFISTVLVFTLIFFLQDKTEGWWHAFYTVLFNAVFFFGYAYITIFIFIPELILKNRLFGFILLFALVGIGLSAIKLLSSGEILYSSIAPENSQKIGFLNLRYIIVNTKDMSFIVALFCVVKYAKDFLYTDNQRRKLEIKNKEAQNKLLQSHFDPHFLFNTINNLYAISLLDPKKSLKVLSRFKYVLSFMADESLKQYVSVTDELDLIENYMDLEKLRYGKRLKIELVKTGNFEAIKIPPMILFVLVENCFKHGSSLDAGNPWIKLHLLRKNGKLIFTTKNSLPGGLTDFEHRGLKGLSLKNLRNRLSLMYNSDYKLTIHPAQSEFSVSLELNGY